MIVTCQYCVFVHAASPGRRSQLLQAYVNHRFLRVHLEGDDVHYRQETLNLAAWREHVSGEEQSEFLDACSSVNGSFALLP